MNALYARGKILLEKVVDMASVAKCATVQRLQKYLSENNSSVITRPCFERFGPLCATDDAAQIPFAARIVLLLNEYTKTVPKCNEGQPLLKFESEGFILYAGQAKPCRSPSLPTLRYS